MSKRINKVLIFVAIFGIVAFLALACFSPAYAAEEEAIEENAKTALDWLKSLSVDEIKGWIGAGIAFLSSGVGAIILLVIKIAYDSVKMAKLKAENKEIQTDADRKVIELCNKFLESEEKTKHDVINMMIDFAKKYDIKLENEIKNTTQSQIDVLNAYSDEIQKELIKED